MTEEIKCKELAPHINVAINVKKKMPALESFYKSANFFKALSDPTRAKILWALNEAELCVCDLVVILDMNQSAISHQLAGLRKSNMVKTRKAGKEVFYSLSDNHVKQMLVSGMEHAEE